MTTLVSIVSLLSELLKLWIETRTDRKAGNAIREQAKRDAFTAISEAARSGDPSRITRLAVRMRDKRTFRYPAPDTRL